MSIRLALAGNPNCGKTTMFNDLTGATQYVGNWPGVTVEKKEGKFKGDKEVLITDLPGIYSLSPYTLEEVVARDYLVNEDVYQRQAECRSTRHRTPPRTGCAPCRRPAGKLRLRFPARWRTRGDVYKRQVLCLYDCRC